MLMRIGLPDYTGFQTKPLKLPKIRGIWKYCTKQVYTFTTDLNIHLIQSNHKILGYTVWKKWPQSCHS